MMLVRLLCLATAVAALRTSAAQRLRGGRRRVALSGWLDAFLPAPMSDEEFEADRRSRWPEQYAAPLDARAEPVDGDDALLARIRPLLARTQLETRPLAVAYDAAEHGWSTTAFHDAVDCRGAALVFCRTEDGAEVGAYNPKGWASMGNARPSPAAFLFNLEKGARKVRAESYMGCNSISSDSPDRGINFGVEALCVNLRPDERDGDGGERRAYSKLGAYFRRDDNGGAGEALWGGAGPARLAELKVYTGVYEEGEDFPYAGAVMDMTSG